MTRWKWEERGREKEKREGERETWLKRNDNGEHCSESLCFNEVERERERKEKKKAGVVHLPFPPENRRRSKFVVLSLIDSSRNLYSSLQIRKEIHLTSLEKENRKCNLSFSTNEICASVFYQWENAERSSFPRLVNHLVSPDRHRCSLSTRQTNTSTTLIYVRESRGTDLLSDILTL